MIYQGIRIERTPRGFLIEKINGVAISKQEVPEITDAILAEIRDFLEVRK